MSLGIPHGECFGLLGQNGAGKTTTFKILTGDETASDGHAYIENYDVSRNLAEVRKESYFVVEKLTLTKRHNVNRIVWLDRERKFEIAA